MEFLAVAFTMAKARNRGSATGLQRVRDKHAYIALFITFVVYSLVSATVFQMSASEDLEDGSNSPRANDRVQLCKAQSTSELRRLQYSELSGRHSQLLCGHLAQETECATQWLLA